MTSWQSRRKAFITSACGMRLPGLSSARMPSSPISSRKRCSRSITLIGRADDHLVAQRLFVARSVCILLAALGTLLDGARAGRVCRSGRAVADGAEQMHDAFFAAPRARSPRSRRHRPARADRPRPHRDGPQRLGLAIALHQGRQLGKRCRVRAATKIGMAQRCRSRHRCRGWRRRCGSAAMASARALAPTLTLSKAKYLPLVARSAPR